MHRSLNMLLIRTRFTWYYILIIALLAFYSTFALQTQFMEQVFVYGQLYFSGIVGGYSILAAVMGGITVSKSDQEFLLVSAVKKKDLVSALLITQVLGTGLIIIAVSIFVISLVHYGFLEMALVAVNIVLLDIFMISIGIGTFHLRRFYRVLIALGIAAWIGVFFLGFPYSPQAFIAGNPVNSLILTVPVTGITLASAVRALYGEDLPLKVSQPKEKTKEFRRIESYVKYSPSQSVFINGFTNLSYSTNSMMAGGIKTSTTRIRLRTYYVIIAAIAIIYGFLAYYLIDFGAQDEGINFVVLLGSMYVGVIPQFIFNSGVMINERAWLSFTSMEPWRYLSLTIASKVAQSVVTSIPFVAVSIAGVFLGVLNSFEAIFVFMFLDPLLIGLYLFIVFSASSYQITDEGVLSTRMSAMQFVPALPLILFMLVVVVSILVPLLLVFSSIAVAILLAMLSTRREYWQRRVNRLVQKGYV